VDSIPKFKGRVDEDVKGFIDHIDRVSILEGWTDAHRWWCSASITNR
jgi:hypothetical protein